MARSRYLTAEEAEYPEEFCMNIVGLWKAPSKPTHPVGDLLTQAALSALPSRSVGLQPRKVEQTVVPLYKEEWEVEASFQTMLAACRVKEKTATKEDKKRVAKALGEGKVVAVYAEGGNRVATDSLLKIGKGSGKVKMVVTWRPQEWWEVAAQSTHPQDQHSALRECTRRAIKWVAESDPKWVIEWREQQVKYWKRRAKELDHQEKREWEQAAPEVKACWKGKATLLLTEMSRAAGVPIPELLKGYLRRGAPIFESVEPSGLYESKEVPAEISLEELLRTAKWARARIHGSVRPSSDPSIDWAVLEKTEEEVKDGKAWGPYTMEELLAELGEFIPCRRVGLPQSGGVRPIDDFSESRQNSTSSTGEHVDLSGVDGVAALIRQWVRALASKDGFKAHRAWKKKLGLKGRAVDLRKAFKQVPNDPRYRQLTVVVIWNPREQRPEYYRILAMPFGAKNAVYVFGHFGRTFEMIAANLFALSLTQFVDDFPQVEPSATAESARLTLDSFFELIGWDTKLTEEGTSPQMELEFSGLGVIFDLSGLEVQQQFKIRNKPSRAEELRGLREQILKEGFVSQRMAEQARGRVNYAKSNVLGLIGAPLLHIFSEIVRRGGMPADDAIIEALDFWADAFGNMEPRTIKPFDNLRHVIICTDGAEEPGCTSIGGVLYDLETGEQEFFAEIVPQKVIKRWQAKGGHEKVIHQAELLPAAMALQCWGGPCLQSTIYVIRRQ